MGTSSLLARFTPLLPAVICLLAAPAAFAESQHYALPQLIDYARQHNGDLNAFRAEKGIRDARKTKAGLLPNPTLEIDAASGALTGSSAESSLSLGLSQEFLLAGKREKRLSLAEQELAIYRWQLADRERLAGAEVKAAFYAALLAKERVALADRSIALGRQLLEVAKERLAAGDIPELEMNLAKVELARSEGARIEAAKALLLSRSKLWTLVGFTGGNRPEIAGTLDADTAMAKPLAVLKQSARANRPDLKALEAERTWGEADIALARAETTPNLTASLMLSRDTTAMEIGGVEGKDTAYTVGVSLSMPIAVFDRNQAGIEEATAKRNGSETRLAAAILAVEREVEAAYETFLNAAAVLALYRADIIPQLEENLKLTQEAYRLGEVGILAVIQEQKKFFEVNDGYLLALHDRQTAAANLETVAVTDITGGGK